MGVSTLSRVLGADKSGVQRAIVTLADAGWIRITPGSSARWELTAHILAVAYMGQNNNDWRQRARNALDALRNETGESTLLAVPDVNRFIVVEVVESRHILRTTSSPGTIIPLRESATGRAVLPFLSRKRQIEMLGAEPDADLVDQFRATWERGYAVSVNIVFSGATNIAAPIFDADGRPVGAVVVTGPTERLTAEHHHRVGTMVVATARGLSRGSPSLESA